LFAEDVRVQKAEASIGLSIVACGMYSDGSTYRYEFEFRVDELQTLIDLANGDAH
jgi:hypothetical protein